jgi:hypothetical protein
LVDLLLCGVGMYVDGMPYFIETDFNHGGWSNDQTVAWFLVDSVAWI